MNLLSRLPPKAVIGMVHFSALRGDPAFESDEIVLARAKADLEILLAGGVDAVIFENNFDTKKSAVLSRESAEHFEELVKALTPLSVPWGVAALWNDYELGFKLCKKYGGMMVRVPVFVDSVDTVYGQFLADAKAVVRTRQVLGAEDVAIIADVQVKHAKLLHPRPFAESVGEAVQEHADAIIVTGQWTGDPPIPEQCKEAKDVCGQACAVMTGSGMTAENIETFLPYIDACIVGSAFKEGSVDIQQKTGPNIVGADRRYDVEKILLFTEQVQNWKKSEK